MSKFRTRRWTPALLFALYVPQSAGAEEPVREALLAKLPNVEAEALPVPESVVDEIETLTKTPGAGWFFTKVPAGAQEHADDLMAQLRDVWPDMEMKAALAAQIEQETCIAPSHKKCWNPRAELKTDREYGFGLGQLTIKYDPDGKPTMNMFEEMKRLDRRLREKWSWEERYNPAWQLRSILILNRNNYNKITFPTANLLERYAFMFAAYNGGFGGLLKDRRLCLSIEGCDPSRWFGHVEKHSVKSKVAKQGYGQSFFDVNREYVRRVLYVRRTKYEPITEATGDLK